MCRVFIAFTCDGYEESFYRHSHSRFALGRLFLFHLFNLQFGTFPVFPTNISIQAKLVIWLKLSKVIPHAKRVDMPI